MKSTAKRRFNPRPRVYPGVLPGMLVLPQDSPPASLSVLRVEHGRVSGPVEWKGRDELPLPDAQNGSCLWVRVCGLGEEAPLRALAERYELPPMTLADAVSPGWRSRLEESGNYLFYMLQAPVLLDGAAHTEHLALLCKKGLIISFEDRPTSLVDALWHRLAESPPAAHIERQATFLAYLVVDSVIDRFFPLLEQKSEALATLEDALSHSTPSQAELGQLHEIRRDILTLRRLLFPYKELGSSLRNRRLAEESLDLKPYLDDLHGHVLQAADLIDAYRDVADSLSGIYQTALSNRMNDIIKILTIISTLFMPLAFITGLYGMNFAPETSPWNMPELHSYYGYPLALLAMFCVVAGMLWFFKRKKWW